MMKIHVDYWPTDDCELQKEKPFYGHCRKCNKCGRFDKEEDKKC